MFIAPLAHLILSTGLAIADDHNSMVNGVFGVTALKEFLSHNSSLIELEVAIGKDTDSDWLLVKNGLELIVAKVLLLDHADVLEGNSGLIVKALIVVGNTFVGIVIIVHDSIF